MGCWLLMGIFRNDRVQGPCGGVFLQIKDTYNVVCKKLCDMNFNDSMLCIVNLGNAESLLIGVVYRSPSSNAENNNLLLFCVKHVK